MDHLRPHISFREKLMKKRIERGVSVARYGKLNTWHCFREKLMKKRIERSYSK